MSIKQRVHDAWNSLRGATDLQAQARDAQGRFLQVEPARKTAPLPSILQPFRGPGTGHMLPRPTAANLRRFAETPVARRAINVVKDRIACMDWQVRVRRGYDPAALENAEAKRNALRRALEAPNAGDSFRTVLEQVLEDVLVGGAGAAEMRATHDAARPFELWPVDATAIQVDAQWGGDPEAARYGFADLARPGTAGAVTPLLDSELMYIRLNPRTHTAFGLGRLEVAFETISQLLGASRYAGRLASNSVVQYALWLDEATPEQHDRLIRWWQDEIEGTGRVPVLSCEKKPEVLRFAGGTDADLRLAWQDFLVRMIGNAFELPPMLLGLAGDVNRATAGEMADDAFQGAVVPVARLVAEHITRDVFGKCAGWSEFEFVFNDLESRNAQEETAMQMQLLGAGVLTIAEVRAQRGLSPLPASGGGEPVTLTIDNLDGRGAVDYSAALDRAAPVEITRTLNAPSTARGLLTLCATKLASPVRRARIVLATDAGTLLFTGYLTTEPVPLYAGEGSTGPVYRLAFSAVSDEWLLDKQAGSQAASAAAAGLLNEPAGTALQGLLTQLAPGLFTTTGVTPGQLLGALAPAAGAAFSQQAGAVAGAACSAYRVLGGAMTLAQAGSTTHDFSDGDGTLALAALRTSSVRELANDVTLSGEQEPAAYWQEHFLGDGATTVFALTGEPDAPSQGHAVLLSDSFAAAALNRQTWSALDPGSHFTLGADGFTMNGGNGLDGQTTLTANTAVELGGTLVLELANVKLDTPSAGVLCGLYGGSIAQANCFAGFNVRQAGGNTNVTPMLNGIEVGTPFAFTQGQAYTLRLRLHCPEPIRQRQAFYALVDVQGASQPQRFGGGVVEAPMQVTFEVRSLAEASNAVATVLYDGAVAASPAAVKFCAVNGVQLFGSVGAVNATRTGTALVQTTDPATGAVSTRLAGKLLDGSECSVTAGANGNATFFAGLAPAAGARVTVAYRGRSRAVARLADAASLAAEAAGLAAGNAAGSARWLGKVLSPPARTSEDCENAAQAILAFATDRAAAVSGSYTTQNPADIWPGDVLALTQNGATLNVLVRKVTIEEQGAVPEVLGYSLAFANDWAEGLGLRLSESIAADALLPATPLELAPGQTPASSGHALANLNQLVVAAFTGSGASAAITVDAGADPPAGGGFEVRRSDAGFGAGGFAGTGGTAAGDLVLRSPVRGFSIPRAAFEERFYVRAYDAATPPHYSRQSAVIVTHMPLETA